MLVLTLASAYDGASASVVRDNAVQATTRTGTQPGLPARLPRLVAELLERTGFPDLVAVVVGPGSFTGLRAGLSVAHGIALGAGLPLVGVTVAEALFEAAAPRLGGRALWTVIAARVGQVFLHYDGRLISCPIGDLPPASGPVAVCGNAANEVASILAARGQDVLLTALRAPSPTHIAAIAVRRLRSGLPLTPVRPLYVEAARVSSIASVRPAPNAAAST